MMASQGYALVVEDDPDSYLLAERILAKMGFTCVFAKDGAEALDQIAALHPRLVLLDMSMPRLDGWEVARRIRANPAWAGVRVLAVTAHALPDDRARALAAGCHDYLSKPYMPTELSTAVSRVLATSDSDDLSGSAPPQSDIMSTRLRDRGISNDDLLWSAWVQRHEEPAPWRLIFRWFPRILTIDRPGKLHLGGA